MVSLLSASTSLIMSWSSDSEGFWPRERMTVPSSLVVIWPRMETFRLGCRIHYELNAGNRGPAGARRCAGEGARRDRSEMLARRPGGATYHRRPCPERQLEKKADLAKCRAYKEGEGLLELGNLLFSKRIGLSDREASASKAKTAGLAQAAPPPTTARGAASSFQGVVGREKRLCRSSSKQWKRCIP